MRIVIAIVLLIHGLGIATAAHAVMRVRSSRGAIAWALSLSTFPYIAIPLYWIFGRNKFHGYVEAHRSADSAYQKIIQQLDREIYQWQIDPPRRFASLAKLTEALDRFPFTCGNSTKLLINGKQTFPAILSAIESATDYILIQFYIVRDDRVGEQFKQALIDKAKQGVRVYFLYDKIGCYALPNRYVEDLRSRGIEMRAFKSTKGQCNRFQINFRNHRKIVVIDGKIGFIGGLNIGEEYASKKPPLSPWRDTHLQIVGPAVQCLQIAFLKDWYWAVRDIPEVCWQVKSTAGKNETALVVPSGPGDKFSTCTLLFVSLINAARDRLWITTPYFVPNESILTALKLAALRGVDLRILLPDRPDHLLVFLASFSYAAEMINSGVKVYRYRAGFLHEKVLLLDDQMAGVGTINLDNRSFQLNFEIMAFILNCGFITRIEKMLNTDFQNSDLISSSEMKTKPLWFKLAVRVARLMSPIL